MSNLLDVQIDVPFQTSFRVEIFEGYLGRVARVIVGNHSDVEVFLVFVKDDSWVRRSVFIQMGSSFVCLCLHSYVITHMR